MNGQQMQDFGYCWRDDNRSILRLNDQDDDGGFQEDLNYFDWFGYVRWTHVKGF